MVDLCSYRAGVRNLYVTRTSRDEKSYVYNYPRQLYDLYLVDGLH